MLAGDFVFTTADGGPLYFRNVSRDFRTVETCPRPFTRPRPGSVSRKPAWLTEADARTRTGDPFITSEVLYQLSYVGAVT
jgi:hypothetical protein